MVQNAQTQPRPDTQILTTIGDNAADAFAIAVHHDHFTQSNGPTANIETITVVLKDRTGSTLHSDDLGAAINASVLKETFPHKSLHIAFNDGSAVGTVQTITIDASQAHSGHSGITITFTGTFDETNVTISDVQPGESFRITSTLDKDALDFNGLKQLGDYAEAMESFSFEAGSMLVETIDGDTIVLDQTLYGGFPYISGDPAFDSTNTIWYQPENTWNFYFEGSQPNTPFIPPGNDNAPIIPAVGAATTLAVAAGIACILRPSR